MPHEQAVIRELRIPAGKLAVFQHEPFVLGRGNRNLVGNVARIQGRNRRYIHRRVQLHIVHPTHEIAFKRAIPGRRDAVVRIHPRSHHVPVIHSRRLVERIGIVARIVAPVHAVVVLEPHGMAELVQKRREQVGLLAYNQVTVELFPVTRILNADIAVVPVLQLVMESAKRYVIGIESRPGMNHAKHVHLAVVIGIVPAGIERRILLLDGIYRELYKERFLLDIVGKVRVHPHEIEVEAGREYSHRLVVKIVQHRAHVAALGVAFPVEPVVHGGRIEVRLAPELHEGNGKAVLAIHEPVRRDHLEQGTLARIRGIPRPGRDPRGALRLCGILRHNPRRVEPAVGLHLLFAVHGGPELPRPRRTWTRPFERRTACIAGNGATCIGIAGLYLRGEAVLVGIVVQVVFPLNEQVARFRGNVEEALVAHDNNRKRISPVVDFPGSRVERGSKRCPRNKHYRD